MYHFKFHSREAVLLVVSSHFQCVVDCSISVSPPWSLICWMFFVRSSVGVLVVGWIGLKFFNHSEVRFFESSRSVYCQRTGSTRN